MQAEQQARPSLARRAKDEMIRYLVTSLYLYVCFAAVLFYRDAVLSAHGVAFTAYGLAIVKALIMGKFMMLGHALHLGENFRHKALVYPLLYRSALFLGVLLILSVIEEVVRGLLHGESLADALSGFAGGTWQQIVAICFLMWLILLPYFAFRLAEEALGAGTLRRMFLTGD